MDSPSPPTKTKDLPHHHPSCGVSEARRGLKAILTSKFSSTPLQEAEYTPYDEMKLRKQLAEDRDDLQHDAALTPAEREYLSALLRSGDVHSIESASAVLSDDRLFPKNPECLEADSSSSSDASTGSKKNNDTTGIAAPGEHDDEEESCASSSVVDRIQKNEQEQEATPKRGNRVVQLELFRLHESEHHLKPSALVKRLNFVHLNSILSQESSSERYALRSSSLLSNAEDELRQQPSHMDLTEPETITTTTTTTTMEEETMVTTDVNDHSAAAAAALSSSWNPFEDVSSWLDGSQGVEVSDDGTPQVGLVNNTLSSSSNGQKFRILGTTADDVSCHPHVLSPPLMESLLAFVPPEYETSSLSKNHHQLNLWLKYSLVRDGATMWAFLRKVRASELCILAIETDDGHVFGSFTSQPWRLSKGWYGREDAFLWRLRHSRLAGESIVEQVNHESEIQVFPCRSGKAIQYCSKKCLMMGQAEVFESPTFHDPTRPKSVKSGKHYGHALSLEKDMKRGTTSSSETFGNPCLVDPTQRGARFNVSNIEVWTVTPHATVQDAEQTELSNLFLDGGREDQRLNFMNILVGGPI